MMWKGSTDSVTYVFYIFWLYYRCIDHQFTVPTGQGIVYQLPVSHGTRTVASWIKDLCLFDPSTTPTSCKWGLLALHTSSLYIVFSIAFVPKNSQEKRNAEGAKWHVSCQVVSSPTSSHSPADNQYNFISLICFVFSLLCSVHKLWMADSVLGMCQLFLVMPPPPPFPSPPSPPLFSLSQFGPSGASLQTKPAAFWESKFFRSCGSGWMDCSPSHSIIISLKACTAAYNNRSEI